MFGDKEVEERGGGQDCSKKVSIKAWGTEHIFSLPHPLDIFKWDLDGIYPAFLKSISIFP